LKGYNPYAMTDEARAIRAARISAAKTGKPLKKKTRRKMAKSAKGRRMVLRDGRRAWAYPADLDHPSSPF
jgi:hypothetical protein